MSLLIFGKTGQVAQALGQLAPDSVFLDRAQADLSDPAACAAAIRSLRPRAVINAAAWTAVDRAEDEEAVATVINGAAPAAMARECAALTIPFVQVSTDYVFDGHGAMPFHPDDPVAPLNAYGRSKLAGEVGVRNSGAVHAILRTSWVFSAQGQNFVRTMLRLGRERDELRVVADQIGGPTPARAIARACLTLAEALQPITFPAHPMSVGPTSPARSWRRPDLRAGSPALRPPTTPHRPAARPTAVWRARTLCASGWSALTGGTP